MNTEPGQIGQVGDRGEPGDQRGGTGGAGGTGGTGGPGGGTGGVGGTGGLGGGVDRTPFTATRLRLVAYVLFVVVTVFVTWRNETTANTAETTANRVEDSERREDVREERLTAENCRSRNTSHQSIRQLFTDQFDLFEQFATDPRSIEAIAELRSIIPDPNDVDIDCNGDGVLDENDYNAN